MSTFIVCMLMVAASQSCQLLKNPAVIEDVEKLESDALTAYDDPGLPPCSQRASSKITFDLDKQAK